jgi:hypothetical protein
VVGSPLVQDKYQVEKACEKRKGIIIVIIILIIGKQPSVFYTEFVAIFIS